MFDITTFFSFGGIWKEGIYDENILEEAPHLLPIEDPYSDVSVDFTNESKAEPNCSDELDRDETCSCTCQASTKCSSLTVEKSIECNCICKQMSIINKQSVLDTEVVNSLDIKAIKERHMSVDSARDSGIGENSNFTDLEAIDEKITDISQSEEKISCFESTSSSDMKGFWQPKIKKSLAERLPSKSFYLVKPSRYIFPGAEIYYDPDEKLGYYERSSSSSSSDSESEDLSQF